jgi:hypothetical protein
MESELNRNGPSGWLDPFRVCCPQCGADSEAEDHVFGIGNLAHVPQSDFLLLEVRCETCGIQFDTGLWPYTEKMWESFLRAVAEWAEQLTSGAAAVMDRYLRLVEESRAEWERFYAKGYDREPGQHSLDVSGDSLVPSATRLTAVSPRALALARGLRQAGSAHPGRDPVGMLRLGPFNCALSVDETPEARFPYSLHLSVSHALQLGQPSPAEAALLLALFYTPNERDAISRQPGEQLRYVTHYRLGCLSPDVSRC